MRYGEVLGLLYLLLMMAWTRPSRVQYSRNNASLETVEAECREDGPIQGVIPRGLHAWQMVECYLEGF